MTSLQSFKSRAPFRVLLFCLLVTVYLPATHAQTDQSLDELKQRADLLLKQVKYVDAVPLLEKIVAREPDNAEMHYKLASSLLGLAANTADEATRKAMRVRSRNEFIKAKQLGIGEPNVDAMIQGIPVDGSDSAAFSANPQANELMKEGEALFSQGKLEEALKAYQRSLALDPKLYHAALFCGDVFMERGDFDNAEIWYQKAIAIDPTIETAYRYSATPLMKQGKTDAARDRYIEAFITEPYGRFAVAGLVTWGRTTNTLLAHPKIDIPTDVTFDEKGNAKINLDASTLLGGARSDGSTAWLAYGVARTSWRKEQFQKTFPNEKVYRHSLPEEVDALRSVLNLALADKKITTLNPSLAKLKKLNDDGLLEAFILLAHVDEGISKDHPAYLKQNRDKLRRYVVEYVVKGGGN